MGVSKESISKFLIGNRFLVELRIPSPYSNRNFMMSIEQAQVLHKQACVA